MPSTIWGLVGYLDEDGAETALHGFLMTPVPEPKGVMLLGLLLLGFCREPAGWKQQALL